jgi:hypothetical protein
MNIAPWLFGLCGLLALSILLGWWLHLPLLTTWGQSTATKIGAALTLALMAWTLAVQSSHRRVIGGGIALFAVVSLSEYLLGFSFLGTAPFLASPITSLSLLLLAWVLLCRDLAHHPHWTWRVQLPLLIVFFCNYTVLLGYLYGTAAFYQIMPGAAAVPLPTAVLLLILSSGLLATFPTQGLVGLLTARCFAGFLTRRLLPAALIVPILFGWVAIRLYADGYIYYWPLSMAFSAAADVAILFVAVWQAMRLLRDAEEQRVQVEAENRRLRYEQFEMMRQEMSAHFQRQDKESPTLLRVLGALRRIEDLL